jgi:putative polymerase
MATSNAERSTEHVSILSIAVIAAAAFYSIALCGLFTAGAAITNTAVALVDAAIVLSALGIVAMRDARTLVTPILVISLNFTLIALLSGGVFDPKGARDVLIVCAFLGLGAVTGGNFRTLTLTLLVVAAGVLAFGLFEALAPQQFAETFNVLQFYIMRGAVDPSVAAYTDTSLFVSSMRDQGRFLLPFLPPHRVSSIFLEPVSMGNFGAILVAFALSMDRKHIRVAIFAGFMGIASIIAADARFAALAALLFTFGRLAPLGWARGLLALAPIAALMMLLTFGTLFSPAGDDLISRLAASGQAIANLEPMAWLGAGQAGASVVDSGYAYAISTFGASLCILLWTAFVLLPEPGAMSARFKLMFGLYACSLLCVSGSSFFALKTAGLAWFMLGGLIAAEGARLAVPHLAFALRTTAPRVTP